MDYKELCDDLLAITDGIPHKISNLANAAALLYNSLNDINWAGFYLLQEENLLVLGPFQGKPACIEIPLGRGVCGKAAYMRRTIVVDNVHEFDGHIACDSASNSEIVIPLVYNNILFGVLDIDSPSFSRFKDEDRQGLEKFSSVISKLLST